MHESKTRFSVSCLVLANIVLPVLAKADVNGDAHWDHYGGGAGGQQYSRLSQISRKNVGNLEEKWRYRTGDIAVGNQEPLAFEVNPILAQGKLYISTGSGIVVALNPATGEQIWRHDPNIDRSHPHAEVANRGVTSWIDAKTASNALCHFRIFEGTLDARLIALDGETGIPCKSFGENGQIWLDKDVRLRKGHWINYTITSPPVIVDGILVVGSAIGDNQAVESELGIVRGIDAHSGTVRWRWDPIPRRNSDPAHSTWLSDEVARTGSGNAWAPLAADPTLGLVYVPTGSASPDHYGGERLGDNLYSDSLVALNAATGDVVWYRQLIHHDVWDYDLAAQPALVDLVHAGKSVPAVLQGTKTGFIFSFNRITGEPIFDIEERAVPQGGVDGEHLSSTQPFPSAPPPVSSQDPVSEEDAWGVLYFDERYCRKRIATLRSDGIFTPPTLGGSIVLPGPGGGINWGGIAFDPANQIAVVYSMDLPMEIALIPHDKVADVLGSGDFEDFEIAHQAGTPYSMRRSVITSPLGLPCTKPPWGKLSAIDMRTGRILWQQSFGSIQDVAPSIVPNIDLGMPGLGGPIITAGGVIFIAATMDNYLRAFDLKTGEMLWKGRLPAGGQATPMTYYLRETEKQYVVIAAGGHPKFGTTLGDYIITFALSD